MKELILELFKEENKSLSVDQILDALKLKTPEEFKNLLRELNKLEDDVVLRRTNKDKFMLDEDLNYRKGVLISTKGEYAFVKVTDDKEKTPDIFIHSSNFNKAINGDTVIVNVKDPKSSRPEGRIEKILERDLNTLIGEVYFEKEDAYLKLDDEKMKINVVLDKNKTMNAMPGHKVIVKVAKNLGNNTFLGEVTKIIGHKNDPGVDILSIMYKYGINDTFSDEALKELDDIPDKVLESDLYGRRDLRDEMIFTIDGDDTKDLDDAISLKMLENGNTELGVHIADVSYYVKPGMALYEEARERGTSSYLADRVVPMLPQKLSNGICSLNPEVDRLAFSCVMEITPNGKIVKTDIFESVISSRKQMTYKNVNKTLGENIISEGYEEYVSKLQEMRVLSTILRNMKIKRGYIDFDIGESKIIVDETGKVIAVVKRERGIGEMMIEDFMIAANEAVAEYIKNYGFLPFIYRIHGEPSEEKIKQFLTFVSCCGYKLTGSFTDITPRTMQQLLLQLNDKKEFHIFSNMLLRSMQKAVYDTNNIGHFGLASLCYTHFTSPIRRFPDTTVHRLYRKYIFEGKMDAETLEFEEQNLLLIAKHSSEKERDSVDCEREVDDMKKAEYMRDHIGEEFTGMVSSIMSRGMYVQLPNLIEGRINIEDLTDDFYTFDESTFRLIGRKNKKGYRLGDILDVLVKDARKEVGEIDFVISNEENQKKYSKKLQ